MSLATEFPMTKMNLRRASISLPIQGEKQCTRQFAAQPDLCPLCREPYPVDLVEKVLAAKPIGPRMTAAEFTEWLKQIVSEPSG
jgi:hypothetical protein